MNKDNIKKFHLKHGVGKGGGGEGRGAKKLLYEDVPRRHRVQTF